MRYRFLLVLACGLLAAAPPALAQSPLASTPLVTHKGSPIAYRIGVPKGWKTGSGEEMMAATSDRALVLVFASDVMGEEGNELPVSEAEARRIMTSVFLGSDSLLFAVMGEILKEAKADDGNLTDVVRDVRTLAGQRAGYLSARGSDFLDEPARLEMYVTVSQGIVYVVAFAAVDAEYEAHRPLFDRVRESLVFADLAAVAASR